MIFKLPVYSTVNVNKVDTLLRDDNDTRVHQFLKNWHPMFSLCCAIDHKSSIHTNSSFYVYQLLSCCFSRKIRKNTVNFSNLKCSNYQISHSRQLDSGARTIF